MNKAELITTVAGKTKTEKKTVTDILEAITSVITDTLVNGDSVKLVGFGTFEVTERAAREGRNPKTGESVHIDASKAPKFKAGSALKAAVK